jgi:hypothetical protein
LNCYRHPNEEVFLRCGKCDRPICPKCTKHGPAGARCPDCSSLRSSPLYQVSSGQIVFGGVVGFVSAFVLGYVVSLGGSFGFFQLWGALLAGGAVGELVLRATSRKRGITMEVLTGICTLAGVFASCALWYVRVMQPTLPPGVSIDEVLQQHMFYVASMIVMVFSAVSRVRFF